MFREKGKTMKTENNKTKQIPSDAQGTTIAEFVKTTEQAAIVNLTL